MARQNIGKHEQSPSRLGRGLGALIPVPVARPATPANSPSAPRQAQAAGGATAARQVIAEPKDVPGLEPGGVRVISLPVDSISPGEFQPREHIAPQALASLAESIRQSGLMQPVVVRATAGGMHELIAGERRWRAIMSLGWTHIPAIVQDVNDQAAAELALIENVQREDLNPMERAKALRRLADEFGLSHQELGQRVGLDRATVTNLLRLNDLDGATAQAVRDGTIAMGHAKVLLGVADPTHRSQVLKQAISESWSVRQLEEAVRALSPRVPRGTSGRAGVAATPSAHIAQLQRALEEYLGTRVHVRVGRRKGAGEIRVAFHSLDEFDGLMQRIGFNTNRLIV
jgi:ParB family chromosome partitioning protein